MSKSRNCFSHPTNYLRSVLLPVVLFLLTSISTAQQQLDRPGVGKLNFKRINPDGQFAEPPAGNLAEGKTGPSFENEGTQVFRWLLNRSGVKPIKHQELNRLVDLSALENIIVIVMGSPKQREVDLISSVINQGGAALVASDTEFDFKQIFGPLSAARITRQEVTSSKNTYMNQRACPFAKPLSAPSSQTNRPEWKLFDGLNRVATNTPSSITISPGFELRLGPISSKLAGFQTDNPLFTNSLLAVGSSEDRIRPKPYRFLAISNPSIFFNEMMIPLDPRFPAPDNLEFSSRVVSYLCDTHDGRKRSRCLFVENGIVLESFDDLQSTMQPPKPPLPLPDLNKLQEKLIDEGNNILDQLQENDVSGRPFMGDEGSERFRQVLSPILSLGIIWAVIHLSRRILQSRFSKLSQPKLYSKPVIATKSDEYVPGVFDRRKRELIRLNNLYEPARKAIREMFTFANIPVEQSESLPRVHIDPIVRKPDTLKDTLKKLWKIGYGQQRIVSLSEWKSLEPLLLRARQAFVDRKWWFASVGRERILAPGKGNTV